MLHDLLVGPCLLLASVNTIFEEADALTLPSLHMAIKAVVGHVSHAALVPAMQVLVTRVNRVRVQLVPVEFGGFPIEKCRLIFN